MIDMDSQPAAVHLTKTGIPIRNLWHMLLYAWGAAQVKERWRVAVESAPTLDALLASILANLIQQRLRIGLGRDYCRYAAEVAGVRGRVDFDESLKRMSFQHGRAFCKFQLFSANVPKNQIVRSTMARLVQVGDFGHSASAADALKSQLRRLVRDMDSVDMIELKGSEIRREQMHRHDMDYAVMLAICSLINQRQIPMEDKGKTMLMGIDRDAMTLHDVYEKFVAKFYDQRLKGWTTTPQQKLVWPTEDTSDYLPTMCPDITLQHNMTGQIIVLDTKFTPKILVTGRWGNERFDRSHLFQIYAYLRSQEHRSECHKSSVGVLLYPTAGFDLSEQLTIQGHSLRWATIDLAKKWEHIEEDLLAIPTRVLSDANY